MLAIHHVSIGVPDRDVVRGFYREALRLGGRDAGPPGLRPQYGSDYYGAFVFDPDGNKVEAVVSDRCYGTSGETASAVAPYSVRTRPGAPVSMPIEWKEQFHLACGNAFTTHNALRRRKAP